MDDIFPILQCIDSPEEKVLATIIHVDGSAYKKEGSAMLFLEKGKQLGMLSAGCLEEDLAFKAQAVLRSRQSMTVQYDLKEETDLMWGQGVGCNGELVILLELVDQIYKADLLKLKSLLSSNIPVLHWKMHGEYLFLPFKGIPFGKWTGEVPENFRYVKSGMMSGKPIFQHLFQPRPRLIIFGAGPDVRPLVSLAAKTGFSVMVCDWREDFCRKQYFSMAEQLLVGFPKEVIPKISFTSYDFVVIATHHFQKDKEILNFLPKDKVRYVGVLGPKERTSRLIVKNEIPPTIQSPIGLSIGAEGPEEIAISVMAQLIKEWRKPTCQRGENVRTISE
jgi:xanthine dehydrogenase accessory factor